jgi:hypothetical protein
MKIENIKTESLVPYARNAKLHDESQVSKIASSIREFGFNNPVLVDGEKPPGIIAGHGRVLAAKKLGLAEVPCIRLSHLTEAQRRAYILADNRLAELGGGWDAEMLKLELADLGELDVDLEGIGFGVDDLGDLDIGLGDGAGKENPYTTKIDAPMYEPTGPKPPIADLCDSARYEQLIKEIEGAKIPKEEKDFLRQAATRHLVFNYQNIAEYYAQSPKEMQALMENSALVIIDFNRALELGYVKLKEEVAEALESDE